MKNKDKDKGIEIDEVQVMAASPATDISDSTHTSSPSGSDQGLLVKPRLVFDSKVEGSLV